MEHPVSFLYHPINKLLIALFGESSHRYQELMGLHEAGYWLPDHVVMAMLVLVLVAAVLIPTSRRLSVEKPGKLQQIFELLIAGQNDAAFGQKKFPLHRKLEQLLIFFIVVAGRIDNARSHNHAQKQDKPYFLIVMVS